MDKTIIHILYSGLGGHGSVVFSYLSPEYVKAYNHKLVFFGIEDLNEDYIRKCEELGLDYHFVKKRGLFFFFKLMSLIIRLKPSLIINHSLTVTPVLLICRLLKPIKIISVEHGLPDLKRKIDFIWSSMAQLISNKIIYLSVFAKSKFEKSISGFREQKAVIVANGIDTELFKPAVIKNYETNILFTHGRMVKVKDLFTLLKATKYLKDAGIGIKVLLAGDGEERESLRNFVERNNLDNEVEFLGVLSESEIANQLRQASIYINCSIIENMSTALIQAMSSELPCIVSDIEANINIVEDQNTGLVFKTSDFEDLANKILTLSENKQRALQISKNAREEVCEKYSMKITAHNYYEISRALLG